MNRRQMIALFTLPTLVTSLGIASVQLSGAAPQGASTGASCCDPTCCLTGAGTAMVAAQAAPAPTAADACDPGSCCVVSCDAPVETPSR